MATCASISAKARTTRARSVAPDILVIDEVGYLNHAENAANMLFGVVDQRYLRLKPMVFTTNKRLRDWGRVLPCRREPGWYHDFPPSGGVALDGQQWVVDAL